MHPHNGAEDLKVATLGFLNHLTVAFAFCTEHTSATAVSGVEAVPLSSWVRPARTAARSLTCPDTAQSQARWAKITIGVSRM